MASQVHIGSFEMTRFAEASAEPDAGLRRSARRKTEAPEDLRRMAAEPKDEGLTREVLAQGVEFVARPGQAGKLQKAINLAIRKAQNTCAGFVGCLVLVSEQEERLVTVVTLWDGTEETKECDENSERVKKLLEPYVDSWLRTRRFVTFLSTPEPFVMGTPAREGQILIANRVACH